jgi:3-hydroxyisobutyrate dehydrogenase-like beta-hydroxyacid dehydrogenase
MAHVAWIGAGKMGLPVCKRLKAAGHDVHVLARKIERAKAFDALGLGSASTVTDLIRDADIVFTCVPDDSALADVVLDGGFNAALKPGATLIDMSTVSPSVSSEIARHLPLSIHYLRSPVSGSTGMAEAGTLTALVSGPKAAFDGHAGLFGTFTKKLFHLGEAEEARYLKLAINSMVAATAVLLGEALAFGSKGGLTHAAMLEVIVQSAVASPLIGYKKDMIIEGEYKPAATLNMLKKDLDLLLSEAVGMNTGLPVNEMIRSIYANASESGLGEKDFFVLVAEMEKAAGALPK